MDKLDDNLKKILKNFSEAEQLDSGKAEDIVFIDPLVCESLDTILEYEDLEV